MKEEIIYVRLIDEGIEVSRPVSAQEISAGHFRIEGSIPDGENWEFVPGDIVTCIKLEREDGSFLLAEEKIQ